MVNAIDLFLIFQSTSLHIQNCVSRWNSKKIWCFLSHKKPRTLQGKQRTFPDKSFSIFKSIWWIVHVLCCIFKCSKFYSSLFEEVIFSPMFVLICLSSVFLPAFWCVLFHMTLCSPPGSSVHGILQARILQRVAISFSRGSSQSRDWTHISCIGRWILYHCTNWEAQLHADIIDISLYKFKLYIFTSYNINTVKWLPQYT